MGGQTEKAGAWPVVPRVWLRGHVADRLRSGLERKTQGQYSGGGTGCLLGAEAVGSGS